MLLSAAATLLLLDRLLFDTPAVTRHLHVADDGLPRGKLLQAARYRDTRVLYVGDSRILTGVDPSVVSETCGCGPGYNGAFAAADPGLTRIMANQLLRRLSPEVVVIGVSQWELSDAATIRLARPTAELVPPWQLDEFGVTLDPSDQVEALVGVVWQLYRYRGDVRATLDPSAGTARADEQRRGFRPWEEGGTRLREPDLDRRQRQWFTDFSVEGRRADALRGLLADLRGRGIRVVLVAPPVHDAFHARLRRQIDLFRTAVEQLAADGGAAFEDLTAPRRSGLSRSHFRDFVHLNDEGVVVFSRHLGQVLKSHVGAPPGTS